jgi:hypothetical protein
MMCFQQKASYLHRENVLMKVMIVFRMMFNFNFKGYGR